MDDTKRLEEKAYLLEKRVDWDLLEQHVGHHFVSDSAPPFRLLMGLLYLKVMNNTSYEETLHHWNSSPLLQRFCGGSPSGLNGAIRPSTLSIWNRVIGESGIHWMRIAVSEFTLDRPSPMDRTLH